MERRIKSALRLLSVVFFVLILYVFLHESGHAIVALFAGARITEFSLFFTNAHVSIEGGNLTLFTSLWLDANGALLPLLVSFILAITYREEIRSTYYKAFCFLFTLANTCSIIVWIVVPLLYKNGYEDRGEDAFKFADKLYMYHDPRMISIVAFFLVGTGVLLIIGKRMYRPYVELLRKIRRGE